MIEAHELGKQFGRLAALDGLSFRIESGETVALVGPSGAGKSTLLRLAACFLMPTRGRLLVAGHDTAVDSLGARRALGYLPESDPVYPEMRVGEYLQFRARLKGLRGRTRTRRLHELVLRCGLTGLERAPMARLSKGETRRVLLADALAADPPVILLDEPTIGLDPEAAERVRAMIARLVGSHTVLFSTHDMAEAERLAGRILVLARGRVVALDTVAGVTTAGGASTLAQGVANLTRAKESP